MVKKKNVIITGSAGFIGYHASKYFLLKNWNVVGIDALTDYYDVNLKIERHKNLSKFKNFVKYEFLLQNYEKLKSVFKKNKPNLVIHLAAQAGVRYSLKNPREYLDSNIVATFNILQVSRLFKINHLLISSTSSVYGNSDKQPFQEIEKTDSPLSFYAATKKSCEIMAHSFSYSYRLPITLFRFFTVFGPWGRPDMALFRFTKSILENKQIEIYNYGNMTRDFTYIDDLILGVYKLSKKIPKTTKQKIENDTLSSDAPFRIVNIGNSSPINLMDFVKILENNLGMKAKKKFVKNQTGDVKSTWSDISLIKSLVGYKPKSNIDEGIKKFIHWYLEYFDVR